MHATREFSLNSLCGCRNVHRQFSNVKDIFECHRSHIDGKQQKLILKIGAMQNTEQYFCIAFLVFLHTSLNREVRRKEWNS